MRCYLVWTVWTLAALASGDPGLLSVEEAAKLQHACPEELTYCIPRLFCPLRNLVYDRETFRFMQKDKFKDEAGCGAVGPTYTYVCCSTQERLDGKFVPTPTLWFYPGTKDNRPVGVNMTTPYPALLPWPGYTPAQQQVRSTDESQTQDDSAALSDDDRAMLGTWSVSVPDVSSGWRNDRLIPGDPIFQPVPFMPIPFFQPPVPAFTRAGIFHMNFLRPFMIPPHFMDPFVAWDFPRGPVFGHQSFQFSSPEGTRSETVVLLPDGSTHRTVVDDHPGNFVPEMLQVPTQNPQVNTGPTTAGSSDDRPDLATVNPLLSEKFRSKRAVEDPKPAAASNGKWTGPNDTNTDSMTARLLLQEPNDLWGSRVPQEPPYSPLPLQLNVNNDRCGLSIESGINARILPGRTLDGSALAEANFGEFPWHVAILNGRTGDYLCGGTIISGRFVVTVAHCVRKYQLALLLVRVGDWDLQTNQEMMPSYDAEVAQVIVHEEFYAGNLQNDIALLRLKFPLDFQYMPHVGSVCLPPSRDYSYSDCVVTGWGQQLATDQAFGDDRTFSRILQKSPQTLMYPQFCESSLRPYLGRFYQFPKRGFICAYDAQGKDSCFGDGGGALVCKVGNQGYAKQSRYHVVGLVSWGVGCGMPGVPAAYTALWDYLDWIRGKVSRFDPYQDLNAGLMAPRDGVGSNETPDVKTVTTPATSPTTTAARTRTAKPVARIPDDVIDLAFL